MKKPVAWAFDATLQPATPVAENVTTAAVHERRFVRRQQAWPTNRCRIRRSATQADRVGQPRLNTTRPSRGGGSRSSMSATTRPKRTFVRLSTLPMLPRVWNPNRWTPRRGLGSLRDSSTGSRIFVSPWRTRWEKVTWSPRVHFKGSHRGVSRASTDPKQGLILRPRAQPLRRRTGRGALVPIGRPHASSTAGPGRRTRPAVTAAHRGPSA